jgi:hypothetical protein
MPSHTRFTPTDPQTPVQVPVMKVKMSIKAGGLHVNHNEALLLASRPVAALRVKTHIKAGAHPRQHNETLVHAPRPAADLRVKTHVKVGLVRDRPTIV